MVEQAVLVSKVYSIEVPFFSNIIGQGFRRLPDGQVVTPNEFRKSDYKSSQFVEADAVFKSLLDKKLPVKSVMNDFTVWSVEVETEVLRKRELTDEQVCEILQACAKEMGIIATATQEPESQ